MKKIFICAIAALSMTFVSCGNKTNENAAGADSAVVTDTEAMIEEGATLVNDFKAKLDAKDTEGIKEVVAKAQEKIDELVKSGKVEEAKAYASKIQQFINENAETIKTVTSGNETVNNLVNTITSLPSVDELADKAKEAVKADAAQAEEAAKEAVENKKEEVKDETKQKINEKAEEGKKKLENLINKL